MAKALAIDTDVKESPDTILVVDNDEELRELLHTELQLAGFYVFTAHNGVVGVEKAKTQKPDVILMDVLMPEMNRFEATKILKVMKIQNIFR